MKRRTRSEMNKATPAPREPAQGDAPKPVIQESPDSSQSRTSFWSFALDGSLWILLPPSTRARSTGSFIQWTQLTRIKRTRNTIALCGESTVAWRQKRRLGLLLLTLTRWSLLVNRSLCAGTRISSRPCYPPSSYTLHRTPGWSFLSFLPDVKKLTGTRIVFSHHRSSPPFSRRFFSRQRYDGVALSQDASKTHYFFRLRNSRCSLIWTCHGPR
ncbi:hypothetical protein DFH08DRAFT_428169 [Mycena albidolilacea]|uniref:Uncharacterized protein n=1 Tax=Mycena albidolilacea TaxID=1033008 RepID=A0AAD7ED98_9AGAR|nr:hypothetical protein DFH08DRAFT_428169 [Mycena albidolilacea]